MRKDFLIICAIILLFAIVHVVAALSVAVEPDQIAQGDVIIISIQGLEENASLSLELVGTFTVSPGGEFTYETNNLVLPFTLKNGTFFVAIQNTQDNVLSVKKGETEIKRVAPSHDGQYNLTQKGTIPAGTYDYIILAGTAAPDAQKVIATINIQGKKKGPNDSKITFSTAGITNGTVTVKITANGVQALSETIHISNPETIPIPATLPLRSSSRTTSGGGGTSGGSFGAIYLPTQVMNVTTQETSIGHPISLTMESTLQMRIPDTAVFPVASQAGTHTPTPTNTGFPLLPLIVSLAIGLFTISRRQ
jgi:hypothetical protein